MNDTQARTIHRFDVKPDGTLTGDVVFAQMTGDSNDWGADGITIDAEGSIYCTGPKGIWVFSPSGELKDRIYTPESVTNVAWGDTDSKTLYLTGITSLYRVHRPVGGGMGGWGDGERGGIIPLSPCPPYPPSPHTPHPSSTPVALVSFTLPS
ncbi:MAG: SMP-30/gluconolactonase/LRE family protein [Heteroscytonema crispum UTEX LB 1556]